jgi:3-hydroxyacyl-[acyl-carrier-protein] dehydratase
LLVDRILELEPGKRATGIKNVTLSEDFFTHHFPENPIMPGVLLAEALVQLADWVIREDSDFTKIGFPVKFERLRFRKLVRPGDQLRLEVEIVAWEGTTVEVKGKIFCEDMPVASSQFTLELHPAAAFLLPDDARRLYQVIKA